jgi:hypothetical protein
VEGFAIDEHMVARQNACSDFGPELFRCRLRSLGAFFRLRYQGTLPSWGSKVVTSLNAITSPVLNTVILSCLPAIILIFTLQFGFGITSSKQEVWVLPVFLAVLVISSAAAIWWLWLVPLRDYVIVSENGFRWQLSLSRWECFPSQGSLSTAELKAFSYRSDCFEAEPLDFGKSAQEKLERICLEANLGRHDMACHLKNDKNIVLKKFFARFEPDDLRRFLDHLATFAERRLIS